MRFTISKRKTKKQWDPIPRVAGSRMCDGEDGGSIPISSLQDKLLHSRDNSGFTLVELLIVMAIIAILVGITIAGIGYANVKSRNNQRLTGLNNIDKALIAYYSDNSYFPQSTTISFDEVLESYINEYMEGSWESPANTAVYYRTDSKCVVYLICISQEKYLSDDILYTCKGSGLGVGDGNWPNSSTEVDCQNPIGGPDCGAGPVFWHPDTGTWDHL